MHVNGDEIFASFPDLRKELALNHQLKNDARITRLGIFLRKTSLDMHYIRNWSIWLDLQILFQTVPPVIKMRGAY